MTLLIWMLALALAVLLLGWGLTAWLGGPDLRVFDRLPQDAGGPWQRFEGAPVSSDAQRAVRARLGQLQARLRGAPRPQHLALLRDFMDALGDAPHAPVRFEPVQAGGVDAEWVLAPGADGARRLLYLHGGAYTLGSARSHRVITARLAQIMGGAVLAIDYRRMPEHPRLAGIEDCRRAYRWMLEHGPRGAAPAQAVFVAGDSAGGNLTLSLLAWVRDEGLRAPDAAVALSPATDATLGSPSLRTHLATDPMLGPLFKALSRVPRPVLLWGGWLQTRLRPNDPRVSPLLGDLAGLPPLLVQASEAEMLLDDSVRYVHKAQAAGSPVRLQTWANMVHVWHIFDPVLDEAGQAFEEIGRFLEAAAPRVAPALSAR